MRKFIGVLAAAVAVFVPGVTGADEIWERRDPNMVYMWRDFKARNVGDILTIFVEETTGHDAQETRQLDKKTAASMDFNGTGSTSSLGQALRSFAFDFGLNNTSQRTLDGKANTTIERKFTDRLSVVVIAVLPNGDLVIEGCRQRMITREMRTLRVYGTVRVVDIGPYNVVHSQYIGNLRIVYEGRGPESSYTNNGWGGRIVNKLWPF
jgi:flagellar L-ring protein precursor FlgH